MKEYYCKICERIVEGRIEYIKIKDKTKAVFRGKCNHTRFISEKLNNREETNEV